MSEGYLELEDHPSEVEYYRQKFEKAEQERDLMKKNYDSLHERFQSERAHCDELEASLAKAMLWIEQHQGKAAKVIVRDSFGSQTGTTTVYGLDEKSVKRGSWDLKKQKKGSW